MRAGGGCLFRRLATGIRPIVILIPSLSLCLSICFCFLFKLHTQTHTHTHDTRTSRIAHPAMIFWLRQFCLHFVVNLFLYFSFFFFCLFFLCVDFNDALCLATPTAHHKFNFQTQVLTAATAVWLHRIEQRGRAGQRLGVWPAN